MEKNVRRVLKHSNTTPRDKTISRRRFFKLGGAGLLAASVALGGGALTTLLPRAAKADVLHIFGTKLTVVELKKTMAELDKETEQYRGDEEYPNMNDIVYQNLVQIRGRVTFLVSLQEKGPSGLDVTFPPELEDDPNSKGAGMRGADLTDFENVVERVTGKPLTRVKMFMETGTFERNGEAIDYENIHIVPVDNKGRVTSYVEHGRYVAFTATHYGNTVVHASTVIVEPGRIGPTIEIARK